MTIMTLFEGSGLRAEGLQRYCQEPRQRGREVEEDGPGECYGDRCRAGCSFVRSIRCGGRLLAVLHLCVL